MFPSRRCLIRKGVPLVLLNTLKTTAGTGKILVIDSQEAEGLFVDYGNKQKSQLDDLKAIEKTFLTLPPQAYHCCLTAIKVQDEWTPEDKTKFEDESMSKHLSATFTQRAPDGKYRVRLTHSDDDGGNVKVLNELYGAPSTVDVPQPKDGLYHLNCHRLT
jgi:Tudor domain